MSNKRYMILAEEIAADMQRSKGYGYMVIRKLNKELEEMGYITTPGRVSRKYYMQRVYGMDEDAE